MIELHDNPEALFEADNQDRFLLGGREVVLCECWLGGHSIYISAADSPGYHNPALAKELEESDNLFSDGPNYSDVWWHVRPSADGAAVHTVQQMVDMIKNRLYAIG
jgi:hypothetical protein